MISKFQHPVAIIFGAGASRGGIKDKNVQLNPPVDKDFFDIVKRIKGRCTPILVREVLKTVFELYGRTTGIGLERYFQDIESRNEIAKIAKPKNQPKDWERRIQDLIELIRRIVIQTTAVSKDGQSKLEPLQSDLHRIILGCLEPGDTIITFNYDLVIEEAFVDASLWNPIRGYATKEVVIGRTKEWPRKWLKDRGINEGQDIPLSRVNLIKLHGSINWDIYNNGKLALLDRPYSVRSRNRRIVKDKAAILAPGLSKKINNKPYKGLWEQAYRSLLVCKTIVIIGYSLPETDFLARALFSEVTRQRKIENRFLKRIYLIDPDHGVQERLLGLFASALGVLGDVSRYKDIQEFSELLK